MHQEVVELPVLELSIIRPHVGGKDAAKFAGVVYRNDLHWSYPDAAGGETTVKVISYLSLKEHLMGPYRFKRSIPMSWMFCTAARV